MEQRYYKHSVLVDSSVVCTYACMYSQHFQESMDQLDMVANPARGQLKREAWIFPVLVRA